MHGDLAQIDAVDRSGVLAGRGDRVGGGLRVPRLVRDQDPVAVVEQVHGPGRCPLKHRLLVPYRAGEQMVQAVRALLADRLGQAPAVHVLEFHQDAPGHPRERLAGLTAGEAAGHRGQQAPERGLVAFVVYRDRNGRLALMLCHNTS